MKKELETLMETIKTEYKAFQKRGNADGRYTEIQKKMRKEFNEGLHYTTGQKYIKIIKDRSVWGFVVNVDNDKKFRKGDILKAAGYNTPARNKARGNILDGDYSVCWTGPHYL